MLIKSGIFFHLGEHIRKELNLLFTVFECFRQCNRIKGHIIVVCLYGFNNNCFVGRILFGYALKIPSVTVFLKAKCINRLKAHQVSDCFGRIYKLFPFFLRLFHKVNQFGSGRFLGKRTKLAYLRSVTSGEGNHLCSGFGNNVIEAKSFRNSGRCGIINGCNVIRILFFLRTHLSEEFDFLPHRNTE